MFFVRDNPYIRRKSIYCLCDSRMFSTLSPTQNSYIKKQIVCYTVTTGGTKKKFFSSLISVNALISVE